MSRQEYVSVSLQGGLGNQIFGLAAAYELSKRLKSPLRFETSNLNQHGFQLGSFDLPPYELTKKKTNGKIDKIFKNRSDKNVFRENSFAFDRRFENISSPIHLEGYFQSWKYFRNTKKDLIENVLVLKSPTDSYRRNLRLIGSEPFICLHIRRGDYKNLMNYHGLISPSYYQRAADFLIACTGIKKIVAFSDEINLAKQVYPDAALYIGSEDLESPAENMSLMSLGSAMIGANSSFSFWAGIMQAENATRIFPRPWFATTKIETRDLLPTNFLTLGNDE